MKKLFSVLLLAAFFTASSLFAADAVVTYVNGKVEVQRNSGWVSLNVGDIVHPSETLSTGFQSEAKVKLADSVMFLGPLTRITLEELSSTEKQDKVNVYLKTGAVRSQVNHRDNKRVSYQVHTAVAVASARGTEYLCYDSNDFLCMKGVITIRPFRPGENGPDFNGRPEADSPINMGPNDMEPNNAEPVENPPMPREEDFVYDNSSNSIQLKANQRISVSDHHAISAPVHSTVQKFTDLSQTANSAAAKESVAGPDRGERPDNFEHKEAPGFVQEWLTSNLVITVGIEDSGN